MPRCLTIPSFTNVTIRPYPPTAHIRADRLAQHSTRPSGEVPCSYSAKGKAVIGDRNTGLNAYAFSQSPRRCWPVTVCIPVRFSALGAVGPTNTIGTTTTFSCHLRTGTWWTFVKRTVILRKSFRRSVRLRVSVGRVLLLLRLFGFRLLSPSRATAVWRHSGRRVP